MVLLQASSEHSVCFAVPEKEVKAVAKALEARFRQALSAGRLSQVLGFESNKKSLLFSYVEFSFSCVYQIMGYINILECIYTVGTHGPIHPYITYPFVFCVLPGCRYYKL